MPKKSHRMTPSDERTSPKHASGPLGPEPQLVERVVCGQRVCVKVYPPPSDPTWSDSFRFKIRAPLVAFGIEEAVRD